MDAKTAPRLPFGPLSLLISDVMCFAAFCFPWETKISAKTIATP
jgi:hypothetical protein